MSSPGPRIWLIVGDRLGDNAQVETLVDALALPFERRYVCVKDPWMVERPGLKEAQLDLTQIKIRTRNGQLWTQTATRSTLQNVGE